ncbi:MAG: Thiosulfate sulfurtransferase GlpE [Acidobacteriota bacterium]
MPATMKKNFRTIAHDEALALMAGDGAVMLDVRSPGEHEGLGHIPGSWLLPLDLVAAAPAVLPGDGRPVLVYCEHGVRSVAASRLLAEAGVAGVLNLAGGLAAWSGPREFGASPLRGPAGWLIDNAALLPRGGKVLDVACGRGRHALLLASAGFDVHAMDRDPEKVEFLQETAERLHLSLSCEVVDLETDPVPVLPGPCDAVLVFNYLHRPLMPALREALAPGGRLFYETFTVPQAERGHPKNPAFLLNAGELPALVAPLAVLRSREDEVDGRFIASVVAERRLPGPK